MNGRVAVVLSVLILTSAFGQNWPDYKIELNQVSAWEFSGCGNFVMTDFSGPLSCWIVLSQPVGNFVASVSPAVIGAGETFTACVRLQDFSCPEYIPPGTQAVHVANLRISVQVSGEPQLAGQIPVFMDIPYFAPTSVGTDISVSPPESSTGAMPVNLMFEEVTAAGMTSLIMSGAGPETPEGFSLGEPPMYFDISSTATYEGSIHIQISYSDMSFSVPPEQLRLFHWETGQWVDRTESVDTVGEIIHGRVDSLSPFAVFEPAIIHVDIDIKPGSHPNSINLDGHGVIPVAILGSAEFLVERIDVDALRFAGLHIRVKGNGKPQCSIKDVNGDGHDDLVCQFVDIPEDWTGGETEATLTGNLQDGRAFAGTDSIRIVP